MAEHARLVERGVNVCAFSALGEPDASLGAWAADSAVWAENVTIDPEGRPRFELRARGALVGGERCREQVALSLRGAQNVSNACGAAAVCIAAGMEFSEVATALAQAQPESGRAELVRAKCGAVVFNDAYNAGSRIDVRRSCHACVV